MCAVIISRRWTWSKMGAYGFGLIFSCPCVLVYVRNHISDMYGPILFVLCTKTTHDGVHMHVVLFFSTSDARWLTGGHFSLEKIPRCRTRPQPFFGHAFTDFIHTWHTDNE